MGVDKDCYVTIIQAIFRVYYTKHGTKQLRKEAILYKTSGESPLPRPVLGVAFAVCSIDV